MSDREKMLHQVRKTCFTVTDANLYLDTHPFCRNGLAYFRRQKALARQATAAYEQAYGPLTADVRPEDRSWEWTRGPWPWETED